MFRSWRNKMRACIVTFVVDLLCWWRRTVVVVWRSFMSGAK
jgi:hypothetical protein